MEQKTVSIIIQARSTSSRFPGKIFERIGNKQILQHVLDACYNCASYINARSNQHGLLCGVALAVPTNDMLIPQYNRHVIIEGSESDVLSRYVEAAKVLKSDFVVRITSDCPLVPPYIISKAINLACSANLDFVTNADPRFRTAPDGHDCEVMSKRLLEWLGENASRPEHREHVTSLLVERMPAWAKKVDIIGFADFSSVKLSIDTREDLERLTAMYQKLYAAVKNSPKSFRL